MLVGACGLVRVKYFALLERTHSKQAREMSSCRFALFDSLLALATLLAAATVFLWGLYGIRDLLHEGWG